MSYIISTQVEGQTRTVQIATTGTVRADEIPRVDLRGASHAEVLLFTATPELLAVARRDSGLRSNSGRVTVAGVSLGMLLLLGDGEGHIVVVPLGAPDVASLGREVARRGTVLAIASAPTCGATLVVVDAKGLESWRQANAIAAPRRPLKMLKAVVEAARYLLTAPAAEALPEAFAGLQRVFVHVLLPAASLGADAEQEMAQDGAAAVLH